MESNKVLLQRCGVEFGDKVDILSMAPVTIDEVNQSIESAAKELAVDLDEVQVLKTMAEQSQGWFDQALKFAPKRNKRVVGNKKETIEKCTMDDVVSLIERASSIPMDTSADIGRLRLLLSDVQAWRLESQMKIKDISSGIKFLVKQRNEFYGEPNQFLNELSSEAMDVDGKDEIIAVKSESFSSTDASGVALTKTLEKSRGGDVYKMIENLSQSTDSSHILTFEEEIVKQLEIIMKWCKKSSLIIDSHENVFIEKRWEKDLDALISEGSERYLDDHKFTGPLPLEGSEEKIILAEAKKNIFDLVSGDTIRLSRLQTKRDEFYAWCKKATDTYIESDRRVPHETLLSLAKECSIYPKSKFANSLTQ
jgi:hypothetical protein